MKQPAVLMQTTPVETLPRQPQSNGVHVPESRLPGLITLLSISKVFREQFRAHQNAMCALWGLSLEEQEKLASLGWHTIEEYAERVTEKRAARIKTWLPGVCALLGSDFDTKFYAFCECFPPQKQISAAAEALQFLDHLTFYAEYPIPGFPYANAIIDFERTRLEVFLEKRNPEHVQHGAEIYKELEGDDWEMLRLRVRTALRIKPYKYPVDLIVKKLLAGEKVPPDPDNIWVVFIRRARKEAVVARRIKESTKMLLDECKGERAVGGIIRGMREDLRLTGPQLLYFEHDCRQFLKRLAREGLLEQMPQAADSIFLPPEG